MISEALLNKYNIPVPRYTSYPTVPFWEGSLNISHWKKEFKSRFLEENETEGLGIYIHLPFCESLCTYCGCNKKITGNHGVEHPYIHALITEWNRYRELMDGTPVIREIHLGGGTPTFFSPANLDFLLGAILSNAVVHDHPDFSFEGHPNNTTEAHLQILYRRGFRRVSYGVQDNDPVVQKAINRIQPIEKVKRATDLARYTGFESVNFDLIYGLPFQTVESVQKTITDCIDLAPDRFAFYSYAHVPWTSKSQRQFTETDLPNADLKMELFRAGVELFKKYDYHQIGMDHFVKGNDELLKASEAGTLHRNFMGYTTRHTHLQIGLGVSAISDTGSAYAQNKKSLHEYYAAIHSNGLAIEKGFFLTGEDEMFKKYILDISCNGKTTFNPQHIEKLRTLSFPLLEELQKDGLILFTDHHLDVTAIGRHFTRNICRAFDVKLLEKPADSGKPVYSQAV